MGLSAERSIVASAARSCSDAARSAAGVRAGSPEQLALPDAVRREPARVALALMALAVVVLVASFVV